MGKIGEEDERDRSGEREFYESDQSDDQRSKRFKVQLPYVIPRIQRQWRPQLLGSSCLQWREIWRRFGRGLALGLALCLCDSAVRLPSMFLVAVVGGGANNNLLSN
jgi:hypothetical protein